MLIILIITDKLENETRLTWTGVREPGVRGYAVRYRKTSAAEWEPPVFTVDTAMTVELSRDDYLFGVQTVGTMGSFSLPGISSSGRR